MTEQEQEILRKLLINLFLERPRKRTELNPKDSQEDMHEKSATDAREIREQQSGGKKHGR